MKALVKTARGVGNVALLDTPIPRFGAYDVLIRVTAAGICGTDVLILNDRLHIYRPPVILGHNVAGIVSEVGGEVSRFAVGDRVAVDGNVGSCGHCRYCRDKREYLCSGRKGLGYGIDGGMAEFLSVGERFLVRVPDGARIEEAATMDVCNAIHAVADRSEIRYGSSVAIFGPGFQGLAMLLVARLLGASPIIVVGRERHAERLKLAQELGADYVVASDHADLERLVRELTNGEGLDAALETTGSAEVLDQAIAVVRRGGCITMIGSLSSDSVVDMHTVVYSEITLKPVRGYNRDNVDFFMSALGAGKLSIKAFIECFPLSEWEQAFKARMERRVIEPILAP